MKDRLTYLSAPKHTTKPIRYWAAYKGNTLIDTNNSIALLRFKYKGVHGVTYRSVR